MATGTAPKGVSHPDSWGAGLRFGGKSLNIKTVRRATAPGEVLGVCLRHNLRRDNDQHRHRSRIDPFRTTENQVLRGSPCPVVAEELAANILDELNIRPPRRDTIMAVELVFQPPCGADRPEFWAECLAWSDSRYEHIVSAVVHRDQARPHLHLLALAVADGRLAGNTLTAGQNRLSIQRRDFLAHMRNVLGLRPDRPVKTLADFAVSTGRGPKSKAEADRRDALLVRSAGEDWLAGQRMGMGVDGHGGHSPGALNPHAHQGRQTPLLRSLSRLDSVMALWASVIGPLSESAPPTSPCPTPKARLESGPPSPPPAPHQTPTGGEFRHDDAWTAWVAHPSGGNHQLVGGSARAGLVR